ncbi:MAG TPA: TRAP transporter small permease subunit [Rhizobiaceae bacterium]|nr:TRAP transporter small permease subunit [Rhizobiaceae bacterium]
MNELASQRAGHLGGGLVGSLQRAEHLVNRVLAWLSFSLLCVSAALAFLGVLSRYFFGASHDLLEEICRFSIVYAAFFYFGPLITRNAHLTMAFLTDHLPPQANRIFDLFLYVCMSALLFWLLVASWQWEASLMAMGMRTMSGQMAAWIPSLALPAGVAIALVYSILRVIYRIANLPIASSGEAE